MDLKAAKTELDTRYKVREKWMPLSREIVADCAKTIRIMHVGDFASAKRGLNEVRSKIKALEKVVKADPKLAGLISTPYQEWVELEALVTLMEHKPLPKLTVPAEYYLTGTLDALGEGKRAAMDLLLKGKYKQASELYDRLEEIYYSIEGYSYPNSLVSGLKAKQDAMKRALEGLHQTIVQASVMRQAISEEQDA